MYQPTQTLHPDQVVSLYINRGWRVGRVLAIDRDANTALIEYTLPFGTSALVFTFNKFYKDGDKIVVRKKYRNPYGYAKLPITWKRRIVDNGLNWLGKSNQGLVELRLPDPPPGDYREQK